MRFGRYSITMDLQNFKKNKKKEETVVEEDTTTGE